MRGGFEKGIRRIGKGRNHVETAPPRTGLDHKKREGRSTENEVGT